MRKVFLGLVALGILSVSLGRFQRKTILSCSPRCRWDRKNPRTLSDQKWGLRPPVQIFPGTISGSNSGTFQKWWLKQIQLKAKNAPQVFAFQKAIWTGALSDLPFWLVEKYRERGLLPVLALSGQHVWALLLCFDFLISFTWKAWGRPWGNFLRRIREWRVPLVTAWLFSLASSEPSMVRTALSAGLAFMIRRLPVQIENVFVFILGVLAFLIFFPEQISSRGFILSAWGMIGVCLANRCFSPQQRFLSYLWLVVWMVPWVAGFFGVWLGKWWIFAWALSGIWEQIFLPFLFAIGMSLWFLPENIAQAVTFKVEMLLEGWLKWEAIKTHTVPEFIFRPRPLEILLFGLWLSALACWNRRTWLNAQKSVSTVRHPLL